LVTLKEIAAELGVSVSMISRVLTDKDRVDPEKRRLIQEALKRHNYVPNEMARGLRGILGRSIGMIVPTLESSYFTRVISGAQQTALDNGYTAFICCTELDPKREKEAAELLAAKKVGGLICSSVLADSGEFYAKLFDRCPVVFFDSDANPGTDFGRITFDNFAEARRLARYVVGLGHRDILILNHMKASERQDGFFSVLNENGIAVGDGRLFTGLSHRDDGYSICREVFESGRAHPTAILCTNDFLAYSAVRALCDCGLRVPNDVSVACFDAFDATGILSPRLTCIMQPAVRIGELSAEMIIERRSEHIALETDFVCGDSCRKIQ